METVYFGKASRWNPYPGKVPQDGEKVLCCTETKKGLRNYVIGYWSDHDCRWCCGMNSNVIAWQYIDEYTGGQQG